MVWGSWGQRGSLLGASPGVALKCSADAGRKSVAVDIMMRKARVRASAGLLPRPTAKERHPSLGVMRDDSYIGTVKVRPNYWHR